MEFGLDEPLWSKLLWILVEFGIMQEIPVKAVEGVLGRECVSVDAIEEVLPNVGLNVGPSWNSVPP